MQDAGLLTLRAVGGLLLAGHGAQKLFGAFEGPGLEQTGTMMEYMGLVPGKYWGLAAALSEFGGGVSLGLGLLTPLGSIASISAMTMATAKAHWGKPIWAQKGGAEMAVTYGALALGLGLLGPGRYSLDRALGVNVPRPLVVGAAVTAAAVAWLGISLKPVAAPAAAEEQDSGDSAESPATA